MKLNLSALCILSVLALSFNACSSDDDNNTEEKTPCTANVCKGDVLIQCNNGVENPMTCQFGCENNACKQEPAATGCTYSEPKCSGDFTAVLTCNAGVESSKTCKNGCANGSCISICSFEGKKCNSDGTAVISCADGDEKIEDACKNGCENNECKPECTANKCSEDGNSVIKCNDGVESTESCVNGCENNACKDPCDYTDNKCNDDKTAALSCSNGKETSTTCEKGCKDGSCLDCTEATEATDCSNDKICVNGACIEGCSADKCEGDNLLACQNGRFEAASESNKCENKCVDNALGDGRSICVDKDYCQKPEDCAGREDGKTFCSTGKHQCDFMACVNANCKENETCVLGACVLNTDLEAKYNSDCNPETFVEHCREKMHYYCAFISEATDSQPAVYKVKNEECMRGCYGYKSGVSVASACQVKNYTYDECKGANYVYECEDVEDLDGYDTGWLTTYRCTLSTNGDKIVIMENIEKCPNSYSCTNKTSC